jgi:hypothetical protein
MTERYTLHDDRGRITGYVLRGTPHQTPYFRAGSRPPQPESTLTVAACFAIAIVSLVASLVYLWAAATPTP